MTAGEGAEQGDVWGPILYSLALAPGGAALEADLRAQLRAEERAIRRLTGGWGESPVAVRPESQWSQPLTTRERLQGKLINRAAADEPAASDSHGTA